MEILTNSIIHILLFISLYFEVFLLITFFEKWDTITKNIQTEPVRYPSVTVIVPCFNEENTISKTILSLLALDYPKNKLKILIVDDGSTDNSWSIIKRFKKYQQIELYHKENGGKHTALNFGLEKTTSELVGCLDADSFVDPQTLKKIVIYFENKTVMAVTPAIKAYESKNVIQLMQKAEYNLSIFIRRVFSFIDSLFITPGPFSIYRKDVFTNLGGYRKAYHTEDLEIALRMQSNHYKIENAHTATVYTVTPNTLKELYAQRLRWTCGFLKNIVDYRFLLFRYKYGTLGILVLPFSILSIFGALYFIGMLSISLTSHLLSKIVEVQIVGASAFNASFDWFFINTHSILFLVSALLVLTFILIVIGKKLSNEKNPWSFDIIFYLFLYGFLAPLWLTKAIYNVALSHKTTWR